MVTFRYTQFPFKNGGRCCLAIVVVVVTVVAVVVDFLPLSPLSSS